MRTLSRRAFLQSGIASGSILAGTPWVLAAAGKKRPVSPGERIGVALIGCGNQGAKDLYAMIATGQVDVPVVCDVDDSQAGKVAGEVERRLNRRPHTERDFRRVLERPDVGAVIVATPDHWHALMTVLACDAGKDVYVEKPACHEMAEGRAMIRAARENRRIVQMGTQLRSTPHMKSAVDYVRSGKLGRVGFCRAWICDHGRQLKGGPGGKPPQGVDYDLWLGPAPARSFHPDCFHREWRWFGDYGTGQLGDRAAHLLDIVRWGMNVDFPKAVASSGGIFYHRDGRDTPDTQVVTYDFPEFTVVWEHRQWSRRGPDAPSLGFAFYGSDATLVVDYNGWEVHSEPKGDVVEKTEGALDHAAHVAHFLECVRSRHLPHADIETGVTTAAWCLMGIIAQKTGRTLRFDTAAGRFVADDEASRLLARPYRAPWKMPEKYLA
ncbi:MAG: Gfo/Idh/MocA family oxidoreductase [Candidatus Sumerlaeia bacterium]|nr:Gfo/Idh/MocA family oxidoreductase [Candidatus Sumerlaeia bacterium]